MNQQLLLGSAIWIRASDDSFKKSIETRKCTKIITNISTIIREMKNTAFRVYSKISSPDSDNIYPKLRKYHPPTN